MNWSINGTDIDDLDIESLVVNLQNQEDDFVECRLPEAYDAVLPSILQPGSTCIVRAGSSVMFRGEVDNPSLQGTGISETQSIFIYGPWWRFRKTPFCYTYPYVGGGITTTHGIIGGSINGLVSSILAQVTDFITIGTIDLGSIVIPTQEVYDQSIAQVLQAILRFVPGAMVLFDYSTEKPTCHVLSPSSSSLTSVFIDPAAGTTTNLKLKERRDLLFDFVQLAYEGSKAIKTGEHAIWQDGYGTSIQSASSPVVEQSGFYIVGMETAGNSTSRNRFMRTIRLSGQMDVTTYSFRCQLFNRTLSQAIAGSSVGVSGPLVKPRVWASFFRVFAAKSTLNTSLSLDTYNGHPDLIGNVTASVSTPASYQPIYALGQEFNSFIAGGAVSSLGKSPAIPASSIPEIFGISAVTSTLTWTNFYNDLDPLGMQTFVAPDVCFVDPRRFSNGVYSKTVTTGEISMPDGIANQILASGAQLFYEGSLTIWADDSPTTFSGLRRRLSLAPLAITTPIQRAVFDTATGLADITFGPPNHLGPQELITLYRSFNGLA